MRRIERGIVRVRTKEIRLATDVIFRMRTNRGNAYAPQPVERTAAPRRNILWRVSRRRRDGRRIEPETPLATAAPKGSRRGMSVQEWPAPHPGWQGALSAAAQVAAFARSCLKMS